MIVQLLILNLLNFKLIEKLIKRNDTAVIETDNHKYLLLLCDIQYNNELAVNLTFQEKIIKKYEGL